MAQPEPAQRHVREVQVYGPAPTDAGTLVFQKARLTWVRLGTGVHVELELPTKTVSSPGADVFSALMVLRADLHDDGWGWSVLVNASLITAWGPTEEHPCAVDQVRIFREYGEPPDADPVDALDVTASAELDYEYSPRLQWTLRKNWEVGAETGSGDREEYWHVIESMRHGKRRTKADRDAIRNVAVKPAEAGGYVPACVPTEQQRNEVLPHAEEIYVRGRVPRENKERVRTLAEWGRRDRGGVHLRRTGPFGQYSAEEDNLFEALRKIRLDLFADSWDVLVNAGLRQAWGSNQAFPCGIAHVRIYTNVTRPPMKEQVDALGTPENVDEDDFHVIRQMTWHHRWAGPKGFGGNRASCQR
ncbi:hypothetical protein GCM10027271_27310 [Saccharopolyspora gloriosae]|uniref:Uncharacterized protein n=1 Tax=Saccharopolyspora gloriosae TaxID=455344 RepID=A0A840NQ81_9PSEU|nr:hypothetical protein [Saccharopolyspora gloriosae]MBB5071429.1 hypothetical protein [Saccharopolyspora gloriosae]